MMTPRVTGSNAEHPTRFRPLRQWLRARQCCSCGSVLPRKQRRVSYHQTTVGVIRSSWGSNGPDPSSLAVVSHSLRSSIAAQSPSSDPLSCITVSLVELRMLGKPMGTWPWSGECELSSSIRTFHASGVNNPIDKPQAQDALFHVFGSKT